MGSKQEPRTPPHISLRAHREFQNLTVEEVGKRVGEVLGVEPVSRGTISAIESGQRGASQPMLDAIAIALGLHPSVITTTYTPQEPRGRSARARTGGTDLTEAEAS